MKRASKFGNVKTVVDGIFDKRTRPGQRALAWSSNEDEILIQLRSERKTIPQIAEVMGRTESGVENRWIDLRKKMDLPRVRGIKITDPAAHFWSRVDRSGGADACWPWLGKASYVAGYGAIVFDMGDGRKNYGTHRVAFFLANGRPQAAGLHVMHSCDNKPCCNPAHLSEGSRSQNMRDAWLRGRAVRRPSMRGEDHHNASLTENQVIAIRRLRDAGAKRQDIAEAVGVSIAAIDNITARRTWRAVA